MNYSLLYGCLLFAIKFNNRTGTANPSFRSTCVHPRLAVGLALINL